MIERGCTLLGVVHLAPLPGSPRHRGAPVETITERARLDATRLLEAGFDGYVVENFGDAPFWTDAVPPVVLTMMTRILRELPIPDGPLGVNVLRNDARGALAIAAAAEADFIRVNVHTGAAVTDQGIIEGHAAQTMRDRATWAPEVKVFADVDVKHASPLGTRFDIGEAAREAAWRGLADALIVTGRATGQPTMRADVERVKDAVPGTPVFVGSGVTHETVGDLLTVADGVIVGTALKRDGQVDNAVDPARAADFVKAARGAGCA